MGDFGSKEAEREQYMGRTERGRGGVNGYKKPKADGGKGSGQQLKQQRVTDPL